MKILVNGLSETKKLAQTFAKKLNAGDVVLLNGDLGAGKTTFVQFVLAELGVKEQVNSPTFAILKSYVGKFNFHHFDFYRITTEEAVEAGFEEVLNSSSDIKFIEWSENVKPLIPSASKVVNIKFLGETLREFEILD